MNEEKTPKEKEIKEVDLTVMDPNNMFLNVQKFEFAQRVARMLASSDMVPKQFRGENAIPNCMIALNLAARMEVDPFMLMQNLYVVYGTPGIQSKLVTALLEHHGKYSNLQYEYEGTGTTKMKVDRHERCRAYATETKTGKLVYGPWISWAMVEAEGWNRDKVNKETGNTTISKWQTMPDLMFAYRAAMFFTRIYDPGCIMGLKSAEEVDEMTIDMEAVRTEAVASKTREKITQYQAAHPVQQEQIKVEPEPIVKRGRKKEAGSVPPPPPAPPPANEPDPPADVPSQFVYCFKDQARVPKIRCNLCMNQEDCNAYFFHKPDLEAFAEILDSKVISDSILEVTGAKRPEQIPFNKWDELFRELGGKVDAQNNIGSNLSGKI